MFSGVVFDAVKRIGIVFIVFLPAIVCMFGVGIGLGLFMNATTFLELTKGIILMGLSIAFGFFGTIFLGGLAS